MKEMVFIGRKNEPYTTSKIISDWTGIEHRKIKNAIRKYKNQINSFGLSAPYQAESTGGRPEEIYLLNEEQATFLMTLRDILPPPVEAGASCSTAPTG